MYTYIYICVYTYVDLKLDDVYMFKSLSEIRNNAILKTHFESQSTNCELCMVGNPFKELLKSYS